VKLGNPSNMSQAAEKGREAQRAAADQFAANAPPVIKGVKAAGATSFDAIAMALNARGIRTARGGRWHSTTAQRIAADRFAANALPMIESIKAAGATSFDAIAKALNARARTRAALAAKKAQGVKLGNPRNRSQAAAKGRVAGRRKRLPGRGRRLMAVAGRSGRQLDLNHRRTRHTGACSPDGRSRRHAAPPGCSVSALPRHEGVSVELAIVYLREIAEAEAELAGMGGQGSPGDRRE